LVPFPSIFFLKFSTTFRSLHGCRIESWPWGCCNLQRLTLRFACEAQVGQQPKT
jgi:hypothetical protein